MSSMSQQLATFQLRKAGSLGHAKERSKLAEGSLGESLRKEICNIQKPFDTCLIRFWNRAPRSPSERPRMIPVDGSLDCPCFWLFRTVSAGS